MRDSHLTPGQRRQRTRKSNRPGNRERWLVSYADFITLLFAFFTTLYAISVVDANKAERLVRSINDSFGSQLVDLGPGVTWFTDDAAGSGDLADAQADAMRLELLGRKVRRAKLGDAENAVRVRDNAEGLVITLADTLVFESGGASPAAGAEAVVKELAEMLADIPNHVRVEGHTDDRPFTAATTAIASNWQLSASRAAQVVRSLEAAGVPAYRLSASGFADQRPLVSNETAQGRRLNRRVDVVILRQTPPGDDF